MNCTIKALMSISLILNLLLAGIIFGQNGRQMFGPQHLHDTVEDIAHHLPETKREHFEDIMHRAEKDTDELYRQLDISRNDATNLLKEEHFNKHEFLAQMQDVERIHAQLKKRTAMAVAQAAGDLDLDERAMMAEKLRSPRIQPNK